MNKKILLPVAIAALMGVAYLAKPATAQTEGFSDIQLANVEALASEEDYYGKTCWSKGEYDVDYPDALVCDNPCKMKPWNPPIFGGKSTCM